MQMNKKLLLFVIKCLKARRREGTKARMETHKNRFVLCIIQYLIVVVKLHSVVETKLFKLFIQ